MFATMVGMELGTLRDGLQAAVAGFEPGCLTGAQAVEAVESCSPR